jgi:hypothetical protein
MAVSLTWHLAFTRGLVVLILPFVLVQFRGESEQLAQRSRAANEVSDLAVDVGRGRDFQS